MKTIQHNAVHLGKLGTILSNIIFYNEIVKRLDEGNRSLKF